MMKTLKKSKSNQNTIPSAWIVSTNDNGRKKIFKNKNERRVYLNDGDQFGIELFNPKNINVLAKISLNGKLISSSGIVIMPGQRIYLKRYIDEDKSFIFKTYDVENTDVGMEAIKNNGNIDVEFYDETAHTLFIPYNNYQSIPQPTYYPTYPPTNPYWYGNTSGLSTSNFSSKLSDNCFYSSNISSSIETGQVFKGEKTNQKFDTVDMDFNNFYSNKVSFKILPKSRKVLTKKDINNLVNNPTLDDLFNVKKDKSLVPPFLYNSTPSHNGSDTTINNNIHKEKCKIHEEIDLLHSSLFKLKDLMDSSLITEEEFNKRKEVLIGQ